MMSSPSEFVTHTLISDDLPQEHREWVKRKTIKEFSISFVEELMRIGKPVCVEIEVESSHTEGGLTDGVIFSVTGHIHDVIVGDTVMPTIISVNDYAYLTDMNYCMYCGGYTSNEGGSTNCGKCGAPRNVWEARYEGGK